MLSTEREFNFWRVRNETPFSQTVLVGTLIALALIFERFRCFYRYVILGLLVHPTVSGVNWMHEKERQVDIRLRTAFSIRSISFSRSEAREN